VFPSFLDLFGFADFAGAGFNLAGPDYQLVWFGYVGCSLYTYIILLYVNPGKPWGMAKRFLAIDVPVSLNQVRTCFPGT